MLGLGAKHFIDYSVDSRKPKLAVDSEDYVHFGRECSAYVLALHACLLELTGWNPALTLNSTASITPDTCVFAVSICITTLWLPVTLVSFFAASLHLVLQLSAVWSAISHSVKWSA